MWEIDAHTAAGPLSLGMTIDKAIAILGEEYHTFKRGPEGKDPIYAFNEKAIHLACSEGVVKIISVFRPRELFYVGVQLLGRPIQQVIGELNTNGIDGVEVDAGYWIDRAGVLLVEVNDVVDGVELYPK